MTGCSIDEISKVLNSLGNVVKDKFSDSDDYVEIKLFPGLKVTSRFIPSEQTVSKRLNIDSEESLFLTASFTDDFRELGYEYLNYIGDGKFIRCDCCKRLVRKKSKHDGVTKYCNECKYKKQLEWSKQTYNNSKKNQKS